MTKGARADIVKTGAKKVGNAVKGSARKAEAKLKHAKGPSPNPMTNLIIADVALRGGGRLLRHVIERTLLGVKYPPGKARAIINGRTLTQTLLGTTAARLATRSVPGALLVGGGLLAKTLYDRSKKRGEAEAEGERKLDEQADNA